MKKEDILKGLQLIRKLEELDIRIYDFDNSNVELEFADGSREWFSDEKAASFIIKKIN